MIVYRAWHPTDENELADYRSLLAEELIRPGRLEIWVMNADGSGQRSVTDLGGANFAPFFHPDGQHIIFASNHHNADPADRNFDLFVVNLDGTGLTQITTGSTFDGFPMFSPDGKKLVFASNRHGSVEGETNIFIADWVKRSRWRCRARRCQEYAAYNRQNLMTHHAPLSRIQSSRWQV